MTHRSDDYEMNLCAHCHRPCGEAALCGECDPGHDYCAVCGRLADYDGDVCRECQRLLAPFVETRR